MVRGSKHGPNKLSNYRAVHDSVMQRFLRAGFIRSEDLSFGDLGDGFLELVGTIECVADIYIDVYKRLQILDGEGPNAMVQTVDYSYNAYVRGVGNILRYDSPHPDHNQEHHRHRFDVFRGEEVEPPLSLADENARPTLGEVIEEVQAWYYENIDRLFIREIGDPPI